MLSKKIRIAALLAIFFPLLAISVSNRGFDITTSVKITQPSEVQQYLSKKLESHVFESSKNIGNRNIKDYESLKNSEEYITNQFSDIGYGVTSQQYVADGKNFKNIIAVKSGINNNHKPIIIGAHYDSCDNPGADDNASGVAGLIELSRLIIHENLNNPIEFVAFVNEEPPYFKGELMGSNVYVESLKKNNVQIEGAIIFEMIGLYSDKFFSQQYPPPVGIFYPNKANFILAVGNSNSKDFLESFVDGFESGCGTPIRSFSKDIQGIDFSDHWSFWERDYKAIMITDTAFYRNYNYHTLEDTFEKLNYKYMAETVYGVYNVIKNRR